MHRLLNAVLLAGLCACASAPSQPSNEPSKPVATAQGSSIQSRTAGMDRRDGFIPLYLDEKQGKIFLEIPRDSTRALMFVSLATGLGSNPIGLDRGASGDSYVARFDKTGDKVLVVFENWNYRTSALDNPAHARTVLEAFPPSTPAALPIMAQDGQRLVVDATEFFMRDWNDVVGTLTAANEGSYAVARDRSSIYLPYTKSFPRNTEVDVALTFASSGRPGQTVSAIVPDGRSFTLRQHISLLPLPDDGYRPRTLDPRVGYFGITFKDYAQPIQEPLEQRWIARHRLDRVNPADPNSPIKNPIVYYIDRGIPEPIRTATKQGVSWWSDAFDRAGLKGAFVVRDLPEGVDPMDARYNVVQWENRNERGWSIGGIIGDPRTGAIIKEMARPRPPPRVKGNPAGDIDVSSAYATGPGAYDIFAIHWGYGIFPPASEQDSLRAIVEDGLKRGLLFLSDADARPDFASDPRTNLWDDAASPTEFLRDEMRARDVAISRFGEHNIRFGEPIALLQERFVPLYFMHRFALNSLTKTIGGMEYANAVRGDHVQATRPIDGATQRRALTLLITALEPRELAIPDTILTLLGPRPFSYQPYVELFGTRTRPAFDELGAARTLAQMIVDGILQRERAARVVGFATREPSPLTLGEIIDALTADWLANSTGNTKLDALRRVAQRAVVDRLLLLAADKEAAPEVRAITDLKLAALRAQARSLASSGDEARRAHWASIAGDINRWIERQELPAPTPALRAPPGDPFGSDW